MNNIEMIIDAMTRSLIRDAFRGWKCENVEIAGEWYRKLYQPNGKPENRKTIFINFQHLLKEAARYECGWQGITLASLWFAVLNGRDQNLSGKQVEALQEYIQKVLRKLED